MSQSVVEQYEVNQFLIPCYILITFYQYILISIFLIRPSLCHFPRRGMGTPCAWWQVRELNIVCVFLIDYECLTKIKLKFILLTTCRNMFELLVFSGALAELSWPAILSKRHVFRYSNEKLILAFMYSTDYFFTVVFPLRLLIWEVPLCREVFADFDPIMVAKFDEKRITAPGSTASSLVSELKLRAIIENARQMSKVDPQFSLTLNRLMAICISLAMNASLCNRLDIMKGQLSFIFTL